MSFTGRNPSFKWTTYEPQSADPANPNEGDVHYSDGTARTEGLWVYINAAWAQISTSVASSVFTNITLTPQSSDPGSPTVGMLFQADGTSRAAGLWTYTSSGWAQISGIRYQEFKMKQEVNVRLATTAAITLASQLENGDTIDGVVLATGNLVLVKNQVTASENGVYVVQASGAPVRDTSADTFGELNNNYNVLITEGTTNKNTQWFQTATLTSLSDSQVWATTPATYTFTVPAGAHKPTVTMAGAGGGGGGGGGGAAVATTSGGGGGGGRYFTTEVLATIGDTWTITLGKSGRGGAGGTSTGGLVATAGGSTIITGTGVSLTAIGGGEGGSGVGSVSGGTVAGSTLFNYGGPVVGEGGGGGGGIASLTGGGSTDISPFVHEEFGGFTCGGRGNNNTTSGFAGGDSDFATGGAGGAATGSEGGGGGGGGGASLGAGGAGGAGGNTPVTGSSALTGTGAGGGGGGGSGDSGSGARGGNGGSGYVRISW